MRFDKVGLNKVGLSVFVCCLAIFSTSFVPNLPILSNTSKVLAQSKAEKKVEADRILNQGIQQAQTGNLQAAIKSWEQALEIYREIKDRLGEGKAIGNLGIAYDYLGDYPKAIEYQQQSLIIAREIKDRWGEGNALNNLGNNYRALGEYNKAIEYYQQSLVIGREMKDPKAQSNALRNLGLANESLGNYSKAIEYHQQNLAILREIKDPKSEIVTLINIGLAYAALGNYSQAIENYQQSLVISRKIQARDLEGGVLGSLGNVYHSLAEYQKAIAYHQQHLAISREVKDRDGEGNALNNLGNASHSLGDYTKAVEYHQQFAAIATEMKNRRSQGQAFLNLGLDYLYLGDYPKAIDYSQRSLETARDIKDHQTEGNALGNMGLAYFSVGNFLESVKYQEQFLNLARKFKNRSGEGRALGNLGLAYYELRDYRQAIEYQQQWLAIAREIKDPKSESNALNNIGNVYNALGEYPKAIEYQQQRLAIARKIKDRQGEGISLFNLGNAYSNLGDYPKAIEYQQQSLKIAREIKDLRSEGNALNNLGLTFYRQRKFPLAESTLIEGIKVWESLRSRELKDNNKISIFETQRGTYNTLQQVLIAQNKTDTALEISERGRARAFVELLASRISTNSKFQSPTPPNIAEIKQIAQQQNTTLVQYSIIYDELKINNQYKVKESELYIWVIKSTGQITFRTVDLKPLWQKENTNLNDLITTSRESIGVRGTAFRGIDVSYNPDTPKAKNKLKRLHELLINPIADLLPKNPSARVTFIPQGSLFLVPFPALQDKDGKYLIEKHTILTSPSIQVLELTRKQKQRIGNKPIQANNTLIVGNPTMPAVSPKIGEAPQQLTPLPGAELEAKAIAKLFKTQSLTGNQATETEVTKRLSQARLIHLATHGLFDDIQGLNSGIALAPDPPSSPFKGGQEGGGDGLLTAGEILDLKLNAELVVLSACDTGRGRISGDGVIGLSRSLITAGVPSVLVSLWAVPDAPTAELMTEFYQNLQKSPDKAQALRQAMLKTMKQHPNPVDWAAFTMIGEAE
ncbi:MAG: tetratricopeptide repeat protein [Richelia sp. SL_2_1]|nr:tetratricopeptide repeat protein [Richelia sp. SL_2_1]